MTFQEALRGAELLFDRDCIEAEIDRMGAEIARDYAGTRPLFLTVMHGGLPFAAQLAFAIGSRGQPGDLADLEFDYVHATRYRGSTSGKDLHWLRRPPTPLAGRRVLLVDDILDEGHTLAAIRDWCLDGGASEVRIAALTVKQHQRRVDGLQADYVGLDVPDRYVFGYGMDFKEHGRQLPAIYAA